jgi:beta-mannanase
MAYLAAFESRVGKEVAIVHWFQGWGAANAALDTRLLSAVAGHGSAPMITWEPWDYTKGIDQPGYSLATIAAGQHDAYIRSWAQGLARYRGPVLLRFAHEMNLRRYPWSVGVNGNTASDYINAWCHIHAIFVVEGATNVQWVWCPNVAWDAQTAFASMFPGDAYLHWVALDGYNNVNWGGWQSFGQIFSSSYTSITALSVKPVMIAETSSGEVGGSKAAWIRDALGTQLPTHFPRVRALLWFNENKEVDWRIESSETARRAFAEAVASRRYRSSWP